MALELAGDGPPILFVHGLGQSGAAAWPAQHPLAARWRLIFPHRPGYGDSPRADREDFAVDAPLVAELLGQGAHLVGHSYGALVALLAAAQRPRAVWSLTLIEPPATSAARGDPDVDAYEQAMHTLRAAPPADPAAYVTRFFSLVQREPSPPELPPDVPGVAAYLQHHLRPPEEAVIPTDPLMAATFPKLFVSGGHNPAYEAICDSLALQIGGDRKVLPGAGHTPHRRGDHFNAVLEAFMQAQPLP
jgi:pimeloyl-ACP methyl ester carboxylesterase